MRITSAASLVLAVSSLALASEPEAPTLQFEAGTAQLGGGVVVVPMVHTRGSGALISFSPGGGVFLTRHFQLVGSVSLNLSIGSWSTVSQQAGAEVGGRYHLPLGQRLSAYAGLEAGVSYVSQGLGSRTTAQSTEFSASIPVGLLVALNRHVALDFGVRVRFRIAQQFGSSIVELSFPMGAMGIQAFF